MMKNRSKRVTYTMSPWIEKEIIGEVENKSARVEELLIKGFMAEKLGKAKGIIDVVKGILTPHMKFFV